jgi:hypothetical protein
MGLFDDSFDAFVVTFTNSYLLFLFPPDTAYESYLKNYFIFCPVFADTSIYVNPNYLSLAYAIEAMFSYAYPFKSDLFP